MIDGFVVGIVKDNQDPDNQGRIKVELPAQGEGIQTYWARVVTPMAGQDRGLVMIPDVDTEVLVGFAYRSLQPYVLCAVYNGADDTPPYANDDGDNNLRVLLSRADHQVLFDDTDGAELVGLGATAGSTGDVTSGPVYQICDDANKTATTYAETDIIVEATQKFEITCMDFKVSATSSAEIDGGTSATVTATDVSITGDATLGISAPDTSIN